LNLNADLVAGAIGGALGSNEVLFMTDVAGIYRNWPDPDSLINEIASTELNEIKSSFEEGMVPKVEAVLYAIASGAKQARIFDGRAVWNLELALAGATGTVITK
jgi:acetylglutamate kinase